jgi:hypothetical protein
MIANQNYFKVGLLLFVLALSQASTIEQFVKEPLPDFCITKDELGYEYATLFSDAKLDKSNSEQDVSENHSETKGWSSFSQGGMGSLFYFGEYITFLKSW